MAFYEDISKYYDYIFPTGAEQLDYICGAAGDPPRELLDIACGTGGYSVALAELGYDITATDIDASMLDGLKDKIQGKAFNITCVEAGMTDLTEKLQTKFDLAFCIGNSVVHLNDKAEIQAFFTSVKSLLKKDGQFIIQIINFDRVLLKNIKELPVIKNEETGLAFERYYRFDSAQEKVFFRTVMTAGREKIENEIPLYPLLCDDAVKMLETAGFDDIRRYGDFKKSEFDKSTSFMLVIHAS